MKQSKEFLIDILGGMAGVNVIVIAALAIHAPDAIEGLGLLSTPDKEGFRRRIGEDEGVDPKGSADSVNEPPQKLSQTQ